MLRELKQLGRLRGHSQLWHRFRPFGELDPERCYISWDMVLTTSAAGEAIRDVFIFVEDCCELTIEPESPVRSRRAPAGTWPPRPRRRRKRNASIAAAAPTTRPDNASSIRVPAAKLDQFVNLVGELVTVQARLGEIAARRDDPSRWPCRRKSNV